MFHHRAASRSLLPTLSRAQLSHRISAVSRPKMPPTYPNYTATRPLHATSHRMSTAIPAASKVDYPVTHEKIGNPVNTRNFIDNESVESKATEWIDLHDPATNNLVTRVPKSTPEELKAAVDSAAKAFPGWKHTSLLTRQQIIFKFVGLIRENWDRLAASITLEQGKTFADAKGDVLRGLQVAEVCDAYLNGTRRVFRPYSVAKGCW